MLSPDQLEDWFQRLKWSEEARQLIRTIRLSPPSRSVASGKHNVIGRYPSRKNGVTIQFESHRCEKWAILFLEHDNNILEYRDQPSQLRIPIITPKGHSRTWTPTLDFFELRHDGAGWIECKQEEDLVSLSTTRPHIYSKDETGRWRCLPGEAYAARYGFSFRIVSSADLNPVLYRNLIFLEDYLNEDGWFRDDTVMSSILDTIKSTPGIYLSDIREQLKAHEIDTLYGLIASARIWADLHRIPLAEADRVGLYLGETLGVAGNILSDICSVPAGVPAIITDVTPTGDNVLWQGKCWLIITSGEQTVTLVNEGRVVDLAVSEFERLIKKGDIKTSQTPPDFLAAARELLLQASHAELAEANRRYRIITTLKHTGAVSPRTIRRWSRKYREAEKGLGYGYLGLIDRKRWRGNRLRKLSQPVMELIDEVATTLYETPEQRSLLDTYGNLRLLCEKEHLLVPGYRTYCREIERRNLIEAVRKRKGRRAAYQLELPLVLFHDTPVHGDRPFEVVHIDHTELDIVLICPETGLRLGRPWLTLVICAFSRRILAAYITFDPPSCASIMMAMRIVVQRFGRLPQTIIMDGGKEFDSVYFETFLALHTITKKKRPPAEARFGSVIERLFNTANTTFIHRLIGNTKISRNVREVTKSVNPDNLAVWRLVPFEEEFCRWAYETYDTALHGTLGVSPREMFERAIDLTGPRHHKRVAYDDIFRTFSLPPSPRGKAKVLRNRGVKINQVWYWSKDLLNADIHGKSVEVRYDPYDIGHVYVWAKDRWVECLSTHYAMLRGHSERERRIVSAQRRKRLQGASRNAVMNSAYLAQAFSSTEMTQDQLIQRRKDLEQQKILSKINGSPYPVQNHQPHTSGIVALPATNAVPPSIILPVDPSQRTIYGEF